MTLGLFARLFGRYQKTKLPPFDFTRNRFQVKKAWPPQLLELTERQQFRFERKFKRRMRLKSIKPQWQKWTKIVQWSMISFVVVWGVFFHDFASDPMNPRPGEQPFVGLREWMRGLYGGFWSHTLEGDTRSRAPAELAPSRPGRRQGAAGATNDPTGGSNGSGDRIQ
jgi:hypothetical protein